MQSTSEHKPELSTFDVAPLLGVSVPTVRALTERGELQGWRIGKRYKFSRASVEEFLSRNERKLAA